MTNTERSEFERVARRARMNRHLALRAKIVLGWLRGWLGESARRPAAANQRRDSGKWRRRFVEGRVAALCDEPRPGAPRKISDDDVERIVVKTLEEKPTGWTHDPPERAVVFSFDERSQIQALKRAGFPVVNEDSRYRPMDDWDAPAPPALQGDEALT